MWLRRHFVAFVILFAALCTIAEANLPRAENHRLEEPCGVALIGACLPRRVAAWERTQGAVVEATQGFTLLEIAIVLMVIGLIVGGILWGAEMIGAAQTRATLAQYEKFNTAVDAFVTKYGYLPGDIPAPYATQFGFVARGQYAGEGDGNGLIEGIGSNAAGQNGGVAQGGGETTVFWVDLTSANMLDSAFNTASETYVPGYLSQAQLLQYYPAAKLGQGNYFYVFSYAGNNYFGLSAPLWIDGASNLYSNPALTVAQAYNIDKKIDDGLPQSGRIMAFYINTNCTAGAPSWASLTNGWCNHPTPYTNANVASSSTSCFDNGGNASNPMQYSMEISNGSNPNCALSFKMQGAAR